MTGNKYQDALNEAQIDVPGANAVFGTRSLPPSRAARASANMNALVKREDGAFVYKRFEWLPTGMILPDDTTEEEWQEVGDIIRRLNTAIQWVIGDWINFGERRWGDTYTAMIEATGYNYDTVKDFAYVCRKVQLSVRTDKLSFGHHKLVAALDTDLQGRWLAYGAAEGLSVAAMRKAMQGETAKREPSRDEKQAQTFSSYVQTALPHFEQMDNRSREAAAQRAEWLAAYYSGVAARFRGQK